MQYRGRVKGKEANNAYVVAHLYYEQKLIQEESVRQLDGGIGDRIDGSRRHAFFGDYLRDEALTGTAVGNVCAHYFDIEGGTLGEDLEADLKAIGREDFGRFPMAKGAAGGRGKVPGMLGAVRARLVNARVTDEKTAASRLGLSGAA
jgi:DNA-binding transcriptional regulator LsrR (DeoR family)